MLIFEKLKFLVEKGRKVVFISCLLPSRGTIPVYDILLKNKVEELGENSRFYSALEVCKEMGVEVTEKKFYSVLNQFLVNQEKRGAEAVILDEFMDNNLDEWEVKEREESFYSVLNQFLVKQEKRGAEAVILDEFMDNNLEEFDSLMLKGIIKGEVEEDEFTLKMQLIVSVNPEYKVNVQDLEKQGVYRVVQLKYTMRNTAGIVEYSKTLVRQTEDVVATTAVGLLPGFIYNTGDNFYNQLLDAVLKHSRKFVCLLPDRDLLNRFNYKKFKDELDRRGIDPCEYMSVEDEENLSRFLQSTDGCLLTKCPHIRGVESTTVLIICDNEYENNALFRGTTYLVFGDLSCGTPFRVTEPTPGHILIEGDDHDPGVFSSVVDVLQERGLENNYILITDYYQLNLILAELTRRDLPTPVRYTGSKYTVEDVRNHLSTQTPVIYGKDTIEDDCLDLLVAASSSRPIITKFAGLYERESEVKRILQGNPVLYIQVIRHVTRI